MKLKINIGRIPYITYLIFMAVRNQKEIKKHLVLFMVICTLFSPTLTMAGRYKMVNSNFYVPQPDGITQIDENAEVCTEFLKNLEALPPFPPMACDVKFKPEFKDFKTPYWQSIDMWENRDLELQILQSKPTTQDEQQQQLDSIKIFAKNGSIRYQIAEFDIDNDGTPDQILARIHGTCDAENKTTSSINWRNYYVYNPKTRKIDSKKNNFYSGYEGNASLFNYKGTTYLAELLEVKTNESYFGKNDHAEKWRIRLYRPYPMSSHIDRTWSTPQGCGYVYLPKNHEGGY